jgi:tRNA nucleotidyltransferase (CCA-adding enzyme)
LNVDAAFGVFELNANRCLVIGRSVAEGTDVAAIMRHMGGVAGHLEAGSAIFKSADPITVEAWIRVMIGESNRTSVQIKDLMSFPVLTLAADTTMNRAGRTLWEKSYKGAPVPDNEKGYEVIW